MPSDETIQLLQIRLNQRGSGLLVDGIGGRKTQAAINKHLPEIPVTATLPVDINIGGDPGWNTPTLVETEIVPAIDIRSEGNIYNLHPRLRPLATAFIAEARRTLGDFRITSGFRSYAEQDALYAQGRTKPGRIVTNARGGDSWHNHACAFDITLFDNNQPIWESPLYKKAGELGITMGMEWGGNWTGIKDEPHFQLTNGKTISQAKALHSEGKDVFS